MRTNGQLGIGFLVTAAFSMAAGLAYWFAASQVNWRPPVKKFDGWIAVLEPANAKWDGQVNLTMAVETAGRPGRPPGVAYAVAVCGTSPFRGELLIGGDARLSNPKPVDVATGRTLKLESLPRLRVDAGQTSSKVLDRRRVQRVHLELAKPPPCLWDYTSGRPLPPFQKGGAIRISGNTQAQIRYRASGLFGSEGPRSMQLWPLVGGFPSVPSDFGTTLPVIVQGLKGEWVRPSQSYFATVAGPLDSTEVLANVRPDPAGTQPLSWRDVQPIRASAEVEDSGAMGWWQQAVVLTNLVFGVCISLGSGFALGLLHSAETPAWSRARTTGRRSTRGRPSGPALFSDNPPLGSFAQRDRVTNRRRPPAATAIPSTDASATADATDAGTTTADASATAATAGAGATNAGRRPNRPAPSPGRQAGHLAAYLLLVIAILARWWPVRRTSPCTGENYQLVPNKRFRRLFAVIRYVPLLRRYSRLFRFTF